VAISVNISGLQCLTMQFQVPQFIDLEDKIIGPLTLKQFIYLGAAGAILFVLNFFLKLYMLIILGVPIVALAGLLAFGKINGQPFITFLMVVFGHAFKPQMFVWKKLPKEKKPAETPKTEIEKFRETPKEASLNKIKNIAEKLNTKIQGIKNRETIQEKPDILEKEIITQPDSSDAKPGITTEELLKKRANKSES